MASGILRLFMQQASVHGARSTALNALLISSGTLLSALMVASFLDAEKWVMVLVSVMIGINFTAFIFACMFLLFKDRDALRSERFTLSKMAMEKSLTGDTLAGFQMLESYDDTSHSLGYRANEPNDRVQ
jgi:hypothetical protein